MASVDPRNLCQIEIPVSDLEKSKIFYREVFQWGTSPAELLNYVVLEVPTDCPFGISLVPQLSAVRSSKQPAGVCFYFTVTDADQIIRRAEQFGGSICLGPKKLPLYGTIFQIADPDGNRIGLVVRS